MALGLINVSLAVADTLLDQAQEAHLCVYAEEALEGQALDACRAERVRTLIAIAGEM